MDVTQRSAKPAQRTAVWKLAYLTASKVDARKILTDDQYAHVVQQFDELACEVEPGRSALLDIRPIRGFWELREKGGLLGKINLRVYFFLHVKTICVLGCYKKEDEGQVPNRIVVKMKARMRVARRQLDETKTETKP